MNKMTELSEQAQKNIEAYKQNYDRNDNPKVFSEWSYIAGIKFAKQESLAEIEKLKAENAKLKAVLEGK